MDGDPLKKRAKAKKDDETLKKPKLAFSKGAAKAVLGLKSDPDVAWLDRAVEDLCRSRCLPLQLKSNEFMTLLGNLFEGQEAIKILEQLRADYERSHPFAAVKPKETDFAFLKVEDDGDTSEH